MELYIPRSDPYTMQGALYTTRSSINHKEPNIPQGALYVTRSSIYHKELQNPQGALYIARTKYSWGTIEREKMANYKNFSHGCIGGGIHPCTVHIPANGNEINGTTRKIEGLQ